MIIEKGKRTTEFLNTHRINTQEFIEGHLKGSATVVSLVSKVAYAAEKSATENALQRASQHRPQRHQPQHHGEDLTVDFPVS